MANLRTGRGLNYEADIVISEDPNYGVVCTKTYRPDVECVCWLNQHLAKYYSPKKGLPVAQHEFAALSMLQNYGIAPRPIAMLGDAIVMEFAGHPVGPFSLISSSRYRAQCLAILSTLRSVNFRHNDLLPANVLIRRGRVKIIDFTLSEFGDIQVADSLPEPAWARVGKDESITTYLPAGYKRFRKAGKEQKS